MPNEPAAIKLTASAKMIKAGYVFAVLLALAVAAYILSIDMPDPRLWWLLALPAALALYAMVHHLQLSFTHLTIDNGRIRYESGMFSKSTRTMDLSKLQDVRVDQSVSQRLLGIGDLSIESAGNTSQIVILSIDHPQAAADRILELARAR
jgi:uncharacterized membrane protein YdbT with pleckstrin-like domain